MFKPFIRPKQRAAGAMPTALPRLAILEEPPYIFTVARA